MFFKADDLVNFAPSETLDLVDEVEASATARTLVMMNAPRTIISNFRWVFDTPEDYSDSTSASIIFSTLRFM